MESKDQGAIQALYAAAVKADSEWQSELDAQYGRGACDARYDTKLNAATSELARLRLAKRDADIAWRFRVS